MKGVLLATAAWPNLHYLFYLVNRERVVIEQHETYPRQTSRNRYEIMSANGVLPLTIPVKRSGHHTKTKDIVIDYSTDWQTQHWRALTSAYRKSPYFEFFEHEIRPFYETPTGLLIDYNMAQLKLVKKLLRIECLVSLNTSFEKNPLELEDKRGISKKGPGSGSDEKVNDALGKPYYQTFSGKFAFAPNLSCLDLLFNMGLRGREYLSLESID